MFTLEVQGRITGITRWMNATAVPLGTEDGYAKSAVRAILGLARLTDGDMARVEEILSDCLTRSWHATGCGLDPDPAVAPLFTRDEAARPARRETHAREYGKRRTERCQSRQ